MHNINVMADIIKLFFSILLFTAGFFFKALLEKLKMEEPEIKFIRILALDSGMPRKFLEKAEKKLPKNKFLEEVKIIMDFQEKNGTSVLENLIKEKEVSTSERSALSIEGFEKPFCESIYSRT